MKYSMIIKSVAGAGMLLGSAGVMASSFDGAWTLDKHTSYESTGPAASMKSKKGSEFGDGVTLNSNTSTLMNSNVPAVVKQPRAESDKQITRSSYGGSWYQDSNTGTFTLYD